MSPVTSTAPPTDARSGPGQGSSIVRLVVAAAVAIAFADSAIVVLALPELYGEFDLTIVEVSNVITVYNVAIAVAAVVVWAIVPRTRPASLIGAGFACFALASLLCGVAGSFSLLLIGRALQGVGAAGALVGAVAIARVSGTDGGGATRTWALAATVGTALGPALGGVLTELGSWRAIFLAQAPVAALALLVLADRRVRELRPEPAAGLGWRSWLANGAYVFVFGALVGALFLAVLLVVVVWRFSPIEGAAIVSVLPVATLLAGWAGRRLTSEALVTGGSVLLAGGLVGAALLPGADVVWVVGSLALCGAGLGALSAVLGPASTPPGAPALRSSAATVGARHAGFVLGLVLVAPVLATTIDDAIDDAALGATATVLDAEIGLSTKVPLALDLADEVLGTPDGEVPDLDAVFGADVVEGGQLSGARDALLEAVDEPLTRAFRPAFALAALLAVAAAIPALGVVAVRGARWAAVPRAVAVAAVLPVALIGAEVAAGARDVGELDLADPCDPDASSFDRGGMDGLAQRIALSSLNGAACDIGVSREVMVLSLVPDAGFSDQVDWDSDVVVDAVQAGLARSVDDALDDAGVPGFLSAPLRFAIERAPLSWLLGLLGLD